MPEPTIQEAFIKLEKVEGEISKVIYQLGRYDSDIESEKRTRADRNTEIDQQINVIHDLIYNRNTGIAFELDRLKQKDVKRDEQKKQLIGLWISVGVLALKIIFDLINKT